MFISIGHSRYQSRKERLFTYSALDNGELNLQLRMKMISLRTQRYVTVLVLHTFATC